MSLSRYDALHRPPSPLERLVQWIQDRITALLRLLFGSRGGAQAPALWFYIVGIAVVAAVVFVLARAARGRFAQSIDGVSDGPRPAADSAGRLTSLDSPRLPLDSLSVRSRPLARPDRRLALLRGSRAADSQDSRRLQRPGDHLLQRGGPGRGLDHPGGPARRAGGRPDR